MFLNQKAVLNNHTATVCCAKSLALSTDSPFQRANLSTGSILLVHQLKVSLCLVQLDCVCILYVCVCLCVGLRRRLCDSTLVSCVHLAGGWEAEGERVGPGQSTMSELEQLRQEAEQLRNQIRVRSLCCYYMLYKLPCCTLLVILSVFCWLECGFYNS